MAADQIETLKGLLERVKAAKGPDREIDVRVWCGLFPGQRVLLDAGNHWRPARWGTLADLPLDGWEEYEGLAATAEVPPLTASIDTMLTVAQRLLPAEAGWHGGGFPGDAWAERVNVFRG